MDSVRTFCLSKKVALKWGLQKSVMSLSPMEVSNLGMSHGTAT
jgi:hypothetical protein